MCRGAHSLSGCLGIRLLRACSRPCSSAPLSRTVAASMLGGGITALVIAIVGSVVFAHPVAQRHHPAKILTAAHGRITEPLFARRHVGLHAALCPDDGALAYRHIVRETYLPGQDDAILDHDAPGDTALRNDNAVAPDRYIVSE